MKMAFFSVLMMVSALTAHAGDNQSNSCTPQAQVFGSISNVQFEPSIQDPNEGTFRFRMHINPLERSQFRASVVCPIHASELQNLVVEKKGTVNSLKEGDALNGYLMKNTQTNTYWLDN